MPELDTSRLWVPDSAIIKPEPQTITIPKHKIAPVGNDAESVLAAMDAEAKRLRRKADRMARKARKRNRNRKKK